MRNQHVIYSVCVSILAIFVLTGCAPSVRVPITRPAEINMGKINTIAVGEINGNIGHAVADLLTTRLFESEYFEVVDRQNLNKIIKERSLNLSGTVDSNTAVEIGKLIGASALIFGNSSMKYGEKRWKGDPWQDKEGNWKQAHNIEGTVRANATLRVVDLATGRILATKTISKEASKTDWEYNQWPQAIDRDTLTGRAINSTLDTFMKMIAPYTDYINVNFAKSKIPESKVGISFAKQGNWKDALEQFQLAVKRCPTDAGAWYNLGVGYEYNYMFKEAIDALKKANQLDPSDTCVQEISNVKHLQAERAKLEQQGAIQEDM